MQSMLRHWARSGLWASRDQSQLAALHTAHLTSLFFHVALMDLARGDRTTVNSQNHSLPWCSPQGLAENLVLDRGQRAEVGGHEPPVSLCWSSCRVALIPVYPGPTQRPRTVCERWKESLLEHYGGSARDDQYVPQCDDLGHFVPLQCHGKSDFCWCVDKDGREVAGTRSQPGITPACKHSGCPPSGQWGKIARRVAQMPGQTLTI